MANHLKRKVLRNIASIDPKSVKRELTINSKTGEQSAVYSYKGKSCKARLITGPLAKQFIGYSLIREDLTDAEKWLQEAFYLSPEHKSHNDEDGESYSLGTLDDSKNIIIKSLFFSSIIFYGKCFTEAKGRGIKLEKTIIPVPYHEKHNQIMEFRHTLAAHSGEGRWDTGKLNLVRSLDQRLFWIRPVLNRLNFLDDRTEKHNFLGLVQTVQKVVIDKKRKIERKIAEQEEFGG